jgi:hypothetical protein
MPASFGWEPSAPPVERTHGGVGKGFTIYLTGRTHSCPFPVSRWTEPESGLMLSYSAVFDEKSPASSLPAGPLLSFRAVVISRPEIAQ